MKMIILFPQISLFVLKTSSYSAIIETHGKLFHLYLFQLKSKETEQLENLRFQKANTVAEYYRTKNDLRSRYKSCIYHSHALAVIKNTINRPQPRQTRTSDRKDVCS